MFYLLCQQRKVDDITDRNYITHATYVMNDITHATYVMDDITHAT